MPTGYPHSKPTASPAKVTQESAFSPGSQCTKLKWHSTYARVVPHVPVESRGLQASGIGNFCYQSQDKEAFTFVSLTLLTFGIPSAPSPETTFTCF